MQGCALDEIGLIGRRLKGLLSCLMFVNVVEFGMGGGAIAVMGFIWNLVGFMGAHKRHPRLLGAYFFTSILCFMFFFFLYFFAFATLSFGGEGPQDFSSSSSSSSSATASFTASASSHWIANGNNIPSFAYRKLFQAATDSSSSSSSSEVPPPSPDATSSGSQMIGTLDIVLVISLVVLVILFVYIKIMSLYLAYKMRKLILIQQMNYLPVNVEYVASQEENENAPLTHAVPAPMNENNGAYPFMQPNFIPAPYPFQMQGAPSVVPPPIMFGQHPIFYGYNPMNFPYPINQQPPQSQNQQPSDEKQ
jgi:hypothetical protein